jgi:hypothetical protein
VFTVGRVVLEALMVERAVVRMVIGSSSPGRQVGGGCGSGGRSRCRCVVMVVVGGIGAEATRSCQFFPTAKKNPVGLVNGENTCNIISFG